MKKLGKAQEAYKVYLQETKLNNEADWAWEKVGEYQLLHGDENNGLKNLTKAAKIQGSPDKAWGVMKSYFSKNQDARYLSFLRENMDKYPYLASSWDQLSLGLIEQNLVAEAQEILKKGLALFSSNSFWRTAKHKIGSELISRNQSDISGGYFTVMGCGPYTKEAESALTQYIESENQGKSEFIIHLGDLVGYHGDVPETRFDFIASKLSQNNKIPTFIVLGDNEWNDSSDPDQSLAFWKKHLGDFHNRFDIPFPVKTQQDRSENFSFINDNIVFVGLNLPAGYVHDKKEWETRLNDNSKWIDANLSGAKTSQAAVIMAQASPEVFDGKMLPSLIKSAQNYNKPILFIHADGHEWFLRNNDWAENITHVQIDELHGKDPYYPPVQIRYTGDNDIPFAIDRRISAPDWRVKAPTEE